MCGGGASTVAEVRPAYHTTPPRSLTHRRPSRHRSAHTAIFWTSAVTFFAVTVPPPRTPRSQPGSGPVPPYAAVGAARPDLFEVGTFVFNHVAMVVSVPLPGELVFQELVEEGGKKRAEGSAQ